jgi:hypothetical protein
MDTIQLTYPVDFEGGKLSEVTLRRPKVSDVTSARKTAKDDASQEVALIAKLAGLPASVVEDFDLADYKKLQEHLQDFFG